MSVSYGSKSLNVSLLDNSKVNKILNYLNSNPKIKKDLNQWILIANREYIPSLIKLSELINDLYGKTNFKIWRGVRLKGNFGETLDIRNPTINKEYSFKSKESAISFTTDIAIARHFGEVVIELELTDKDSYLNITPELAFVISHHVRNIKPETQEEIILLPSIDATFKIVEINKRPFWLF